MYMYAISILHLVLRFCDCNLELFRQDDYFGFLGFIFFILLHFCL
jgi:hypothetical protein